MQNMLNLASRLTLIITFLFCFAGKASANDSDVVNCNRAWTVVVLGSSTAFGTGASTYDSSWVGKFTAYLSRKNSQNIVYNLGIPGFTTYQNLCPTGFIPPANRPSPNSSFNITAALEIHPDAIIINMPSNDAANGYSQAEQQANFERTMHLADSANVPVWVTTTQPRNNMSAGQIANLIAMRDWIYTRFANKAVDFWTTVANGDGSIVPFYDFDDVHLNNAGHDVFYNRMKAETILDSLCIRNTPTLVANAGNDINVILPASSTSLDGSASFSSLGGVITNYQWIQVSAPAGSNAQIVSPNSAISSLTNLTEGRYSFSLTVTDNTLSVKADTVNVVVSSRILIEFGPDLTASPDANGNTWNTLTQTQTGASLSNIVTTGNSPTSIGFLVVNRIDGTFNVAGPGTNTGNTTGAVGDYPSTATSDFSFAEASATNGQWRITGLESIKQYTIKFWGTRSVIDDRVIQIKRADQSTWQEYNAAENTNFSTSAVFTFSGKTQMTFDIRVKSGSPFGYISLIDITRTAPLIALNVPPTARANDVNVALPATSGTLDGTASSDDDGNITNYQWTQTSGPSVAQIVDPASAVTVVNNLIEGIYTFQLTVTDDSSATASTSITLTVNSRVLFDIGPDPTPAPDAGGKFWNNIANGQEGVKIADAVTTGNTATGISFEIINRIDGTFNVGGPGTNTGNTTGNVGDYPATATTDYAFAHPSATNGQWKISGLDNTKQYTVKFWGTRTGISDQRYIQIKRSDETEYQQYDAANNSDFNNAAVFTFTGQSEMTFDIKVRDGDAFSYISVVDVKITNATVTCIPSVTITADPATAICPGSSVTFTATPTNGGTAPTYQWFNGLAAINGATGSTYTTSTLANGDAISVVLTSNDVCAAGAIATSNTIVMNVNPQLPVSVSVTANPGNIICEGTTVTFTATPTNGGDSPTYQWFNGASPIIGETASTYTSSTVANGDAINVVLTSNATPCATGSPATSNTIDMTVNPYLPVSVSIAADPGNIICEGTAVTFTATPVNGGLNPTYQWFNGASPILGETASTYTSSALVNADAISVLLASNVSQCTTGNPATSNIISVTVNPNLPVSVSIAANPGNIVCDGTAVTFTATSVNAGDTPTYQWFNGAAPIIGENASTYTSSALVNGDAISVVLTSNAAPCATGNPASSNVINMTINPNLPVSVSITAEPVNIICDGTPVTFTASSVNGGDSPAYQWFNGATPIIGETASTYTSSTLINGDQISVALSSNAAPCAIGNPAASNTISMTVNPLQPISVAISSDAGNTICDGTTVIFTATPTNGGDNPTYQWFNGTNPIIGETASTYTSSALVNGDVISVVLTSNAAPCPVNNPATSNAITMTVNPLLPVSVNLDSNPRNVICDGATVTFTATPTNGGSNPTYQWFNGGSLIVGESGNTYVSSTLQNGDAISVVVTSNEACAVDNPATSNTILITFTATLPVSVSITADPGNTICEGTAVTFTASPTNGGNFPSYQWFNGATAIGGATNDTYTSSGLVNADAISVVLTSNIAFCVTGNPATSNTINMTVNPIQPTSVSISANPGSTICDGTSVTFTATPTNGGVAPAYQWFNAANAIPGETAGTYTSSTLINGDAISVVMTSSELCTNPATSNIIDLTVNPNLPVSVSITADPGATICDGTSVTFTATPTNGGSNPSYQWFNGANPIIGATSGTYTSSALLNGDLISVVLTSSESTCVTGNPASSNTIAMQVNQNLPVSVSIAANPGNTICDGTAVTFTATAINGGVNPTYQWFNAANAIVGETASTYTSSALLNGDAIRVELTSSETCTTGNPASSNTISMTVNPNLAVSVTISAFPGNAVCKSVPVTFTATGINSGSNPTYQWFNGANPIIGETSSTYTSAALLTGAEISVVLTSDAAPCASGSPATSNTITMTVTQTLPVSVTIAADPGDAVCSGSVVTFTATPTNGGVTPTYQWFNGPDPIVGETGSSYTSSNLQNGDAISVLLTANGIPCATGNPAVSNTITMSVSPPLAVSVSIAANTATTICSGTSVTFTASPVNGGNNPTYQWFNGANAIIGETGSTYTSATLVNGDAISVVLTSNANCTTGSPANSNSIIMVVNPALPVSVSIAANPGNSICAGTAVTFTASPVNAGNNPSYQWFNGTNPIIGETGSTYSSSALLNGDAISVVLSSDAAPCSTGSPATSNTITMSVGENLPVSVSISANPGNIVCSGTSVTFTASPTNGGNNPAYQWFNGADPIVGETGSTYTSSALTNADAISVLLTSSATACTTGNPATSNTINMTINQNLPVSVSINANPGNTICSGTPVTFTATPTNGGNNPAYQWFNGANPIGGATSNTYTSSTLTNGDAITVAVTSDALPCATGNPATSNIITMTVNENLPVSVIIAANPGNTICSGTAVTFTATGTNSGDNPTYQWFNGVNPIIGATGPTYTSSTLVGGDAISVTLTSNASACTTGNPATSNTITMIISQNLPISVSIAANPGNSICDGTAVTFTASPINAGNNPSYQWFNGPNAINGETGSTYTSSTLANGDAITVVLTANGIPCTTGSPATSNTITMAVNQILPVSVNISASPGNSICSGVAVTFTANATNAGSNPTYQWFNGANAIIGQTGNTYTTSTLADGDNISVVLTANGSACTSGSPATSNTITMTVIANIAPTVSIVANPGNNICAGTTVTFTATALNAGNSPSYQWTKNGIPEIGANTAVYIAAGLVDNDVIRCVVTVNTACVSNLIVNSNNITISVFPVLPKPGNISGPTSVCQLMGTANNATYSIAAMPNVNLYTWTVPAGASIVSGQGTTSIVVNFTSNFVPVDTIRVIAGGCPDSRPSKLSINASLPALPGPITGPTNACPFVGQLTNAVYSISPVATANSYTWSVPTGAQIVAGQGTTSIQVSYNSAFLYGSIRVVSNAGCGSSANRTLSVTRLIPVTPGAISGPTLSCAFIGTNLEAVYSIAAVPNAASYTWTLPANTNLVSGQGSTSIHVTFNVGFVGGVIQVKSVSNCYTSANSSINITTTASQTPGPISGPTNACPFINSTDQATYTINQVAGASSYIWTVPAGVTINLHPGGAGVNDTIITVSFDNNFVSGTNISVQSSACVVSNSRTLTVIRSGVSPATAAAISGPVNVCPFVGTGDLVTYTIARVANASFYNWSVPAGATLLSHPAGIGSNDTIILVSYNTGFTEGNISVMTGNACASNNIEKKLAVSAVAPVSTPTITGPTDPCPFIGTTATYKINKITNATGYTWTVPAQGATAVHPNGPGVNDTIIIVTFTANFTSGNITARADAACGNTGTRTLVLVRKLPSIPAPISTTLLTACPNRQYSYSIASLPANANSARWTVPAGATIVSGQGTTSIVVNYPATAIASAVSVVGVNNCGDGSSIRTININLPACSGPRPEAVWDITVMPNPTYGEFKLVVVSDDHDSPIQIRLSDISGKKIENRSGIIPGQTITLGGNYIKGVYIAEIIQGDKRKNIKLVKL